MASSLFSVPTEILLVVVEAINDSASLRSFALTCKFARLLAEPVLYRAVLVSTGSQALCLATALRQQQPPKRAELVHTLDLRPEYRRDADIEALIPLVGAMTQLHALSIEPPSADYFPWLSDPIRWEALMQGYCALFLDAQCGTGLQKLQSLKIHWPGDGSRCWLFSEFKHILMLPALQSLTIGCAVLGDDLADGLAAFAGTTPLTHLELVECFVSQKALTAVLALPRALRSCHQGIVRYHAPPSDTFHEASPEQQLEALLQQCHSLQQLTWFSDDFASTTDMHRVAVPGKGLSDFTELHTLTIDGPSALLFSALLSDCAPPSLDRLRIIRHNKDTILDHPTDSVAYMRIPGIPPPFALHQHLPKLHHLDLIFLCDRYNAEPLWVEPDRREHVKRLGEDYQACGIRLVIFAASRGNVVPPYLFGEEVPFEEPAYSAENAWFSPGMT
ncbi:hypothetical protein B0H11DRAFT_867955 [Mycena galericulata]|nr:hypothetical protein B0H11DRAFT_867955 [Mycena galericulata]